MVANNIKRHIAIFIALLVGYFVLDYVFNNFMLYIVGGVVGGSISELLQSLGVKNRTIPINIIWILLLSATVILFYRFKRKPLKYFTLILIAILLYVIDVIFAEIPIPETMSIENASTLGNVYLSISIFLKSLILSLIISIDIKRNKPTS